MDIHGCDRHFPQVGNIDLGRGRSCGQVVLGILICSVEAIFEECVGHLEEVDGREFLLSGIIL